MFNSRCSILNFQSEERIWSMVIFFAMIRGGKMDIDEIRFLY